jgi:hypothetical protein
MRDAPAGVGAAHPALFPPAFAMSICNILRCGISVSPPHAMAATNAQRWRRSSVARCPAADCPAAGAVLRYGDAALKKCRRWRGVSIKRTGGTFYMNENGE